LVPLFLFICAICFLVGIVGGIYGIGGGSIVAPLLVAIVGFPVYTVAEAALMGTFFTSVAGVAFYQYLSLVYTNMSVAPDCPMGALFGFGGSLGMYLGTRTQRHVPARAIKGPLCFCVLLVALRYVVGYSYNSSKPSCGPLRCKPAPVAGAIGFDSRRLLIK
jgi:uncharacterized membrane protein YfcA